MAIIYTYPEINQVEGEDLLLISDTSLYKRPTRSVTIDNLAAYIGTVVGVVQNLQSVLTVGNTYVSPDGYGTFTLNDITNNDGQIKYLNTDEGWGYFLNAEEGLFFTDGTGSQTGSTSIGLGYVSIGNSNHIGEIRSANITANRTYQLPNASGTIALENVSEWYNITGSRGLGNLLVKIGDYDNSGSGFKLVVDTEDSVAEVSEGSKILRLTPSTLEWEDTYQSSLQLLSVTGNRIWSLPDASGTIALTSDIPTPGPSGSGTTNYTARWTSASTLGIGALYDNGTSVGIGINGTYANPPQRLTVVSDDSLQPVAQFKNVGTGGGLFVRTDGTTRPLFELFSGSSYRVVVTGAGNLGIGTTSPSQKLEVIGNVKVSSTIYSPNLATWGNVPMTIRSDDYIRFLTSSSNNERMRILNNGNIGIGTTSPSDKLEVYGGNLIVNDGTSKSRLRPSDLYMQQAGVIKAWLRADGNSYLNGGNLGIGTTSPAYILDVVSAGAATARLKSAGTGAISLRYENGSGFKSAAVVDNNGLYRLDATNISLNPTNNVGIGTTNPSTKLHVQGAASGYLFRVQGTSTLNVYDPGATAEIGVGSGSGDKLKLFSNDSLNNGITIDTSGNVGIGTTNPSQKLTVLGIGSFGTSTSQTLVDYDGLNAVGNTDYIRFKVDNSEKLRIKSDGNVGIGTTSPTEKLEVVGNIRIDSTSAAQLFLDSAAGNDSVINFQEGATQKAKIGYDNSLSGFAVVTGSGPYSTADMVILDSGNVGIGTTSPSQKLDVNGAVLAGDYRGSNQVYLTSPDNWIFRSTTGNERMRVTSAGNVGIGTTSPSEKLHVVGYAKTSIGLKAGNYTILNESGNETSLSNTAYYPMFFKTNNSTRMTISNAGNVGIGTTSPSEKLHIAGGGSGNIRLDSGGTYYGTNIQAISSAGLKIGNDDFSGYAYFHNDGNVGIGTTTPGYKLEVAGTARITSALTLGGNVNNRIEGTGSSLDFKSNGEYYFRKGANTHLTILSGGNVGIGTTAPTTKLHVDGDIRIQGENELYFGGTGSVPHWEITASGSDLIVNDTGTNVGSVLFNNDEGVALPRLTTTEINAISSPAQGLMAYNTTLNTICFYNGSSWQKVSHTSM